MSEESERSTRVASVLNLIDKSENETVIDVGDKQILPKKNTFPRVTFGGVPTGSATNVITDKNADPNYVYLTPIKSENKADEQACAANLRTQLSLDKLVPVGQTSSISMLEPVKKRKRRMGLKITLKKITKQMFGCLEENYAYIDKPVVFFIDEINNSKMSSLLSNLTDDDDIQFVKSC